jgi:hypothetical protein
MATRAEYFSKMMQSGAITPNEIRAKEGLAGYVGGDRFFIATNNFTPEDRMDEIIDAQIAPKQIAAPKEVETPPDAVAVAARERLLEILNNKN